MTDTDTALIAKAEALASADYPGIVATVEWKMARDRHLIRLAELRNAVREHKPSEARRVWDAAYEAAERSHGGELDDNSTAIIEAALAKAEERGAERERKACAALAEASAKNDRADYSRCVDSIMRQQFIWGFQSAEHIAAAIRARGGL